MKMSEFSLHNRVNVVVFVNFGDLAFSVYNILKNYLTSEDAWGWTSIKYANLGLFRHPYPTLVPTTIEWKLNYNWVWTTNDRFRAPVPYINLCKCDLSLTVISKFIFHLIPNQFPFNFQLLNSQSQPIAIHFPF